MSLATKGCFEKTSHVTVLTQRAYNSACALPKVTFDVKAFPARKGLLQPQKPQQASPGSPLSISELRVHAMSGATVTEDIRRGLCTEGSHTAEQGRAHIRTKLPNLSTQRWISLSLEWILCPLHSLTQSTGDSACHLSLPCDVWLH